MPNTEDGVDLDHGLEDYLSPFLLFSLKSAFLWLQGDVISLSSLLLIPKNILNVGLQGLVAMYV